MHQRTNPELKTDLKIEFSPNKSIFLVKNVWRNCSPLDFIGALRLSYFTSIQPEKWKFSDSIKNDEKPCQGMNLVGFQLGPTRLNLVGQLENTWKVWTWLKTPTQKLDIFQLGWKFKLKNSIFWEFNLVQPRWIG